MGQLAQATAGQQLQPLNTMSDMHQLIASHRKQIESVMSGALTADRLYGLLQSAVSREPKLLQCTPESIVACCMKCSTLGLEPSSVDGLGKAYILPYGNKNLASGRPEATFILGYKGMLDLARRSGELKSITVTAAFDGDSIELMMGQDGEPWLKEMPINLDASHDPANLRFVFLCAKFTNGGSHAEYMTKSEIDAVRARSKAGNTGPWKSDYVAMAKKTIIRRSFPYLPIDTQAQKAAVADETTPSYGFLAGPADTIEGE